MRGFLAAFTLALIVSAALTPIVRLLALRIGATSKPGGRHVHATLTPRLGGVAIVIGFLVPLGALMVVNNSSVAALVRHEGLRPIGLLVGSLIMCGVGVVDDTRGMRAIHKLLVQVVAASFAFGCGFRIDSISLPVIGTLSMGIFAFFVTVIWIVGIINAVNLIDGLDGLAGGVILFASITNFIIANMEGNVFIAAVTASIAGAVLGFLFFNFNPARIFMGDSGSYFLGYALGTIALGGPTASQKASTAVAMLVPCLALGVPIFDTLFSMVRRFLERRPMFSPDRGHLHHRLIDMGLTHRRAVLTIYAVSLVLCVSAIAVTFGRGWQVGAAVLIASAVLVALVRFAGYFEYLRVHLRRRGRIRSPLAQALRRAVPDAIERLALAQSEDDVWRAIGAAMEGMRPLPAFVRVERVADGVTAYESAHDADDTGELVARPIGEEAIASAQMLVAVPAESGLDAEVEILVQLFVDAVERALARVRSPLAPKRREVRRPVESPAETKLPVGESARS